MEIFYFTHFMLFPVLLGFGKLGNVGPQVQRVEIASQISHGVIDLLIAGVGFPLDVLEALFSFLSLKFLLIVVLERMAPPGG